ncbi:MAG: alpha/beta hydrolase [Candidatus Binatia bacterium]
MRATVTNAKRRPLEPHRPVDQSLQRQARNIVRLALLVSLVAGVWFINRPVCQACGREEVWLSLADGTPIYGRLYTPPHAANHLPAVVVCPGYLANLAFMESPWAADLTHLGAVVFLLDRRGQGRSGGSWWPATPSTTQRLFNADPDILAAITYLRSRTPLVDPDRIALLGHSDGGTGVIMAASADWDVSATVSLSASVAPWEFVNHEAPANLLLLYGAEDRFVLQNTDQRLIASATRGYLEGEGMVGQLRDGSARRLVRVPGRGHIDLLYSETARREVLRWIAEALRLDRAIDLSPPRVTGVLMGVALLFAILLFWHGLPRIVLPVGWRGWLTIAAVAGLWTSGLMLAAPAALRMTWVPAAEGSVVVAVLTVEMLLMASLILLLMVIGWRSRPSFPRPAEILANVGRGAAAGALFLLVLHVVLRPVYETTLNLQRALLFALFTVIALPAFAAIELAGTSAPAICGRLSERLPMEFMLAIVASAVAPHWFARMSVLPVYLLAAALAFAGAYRAGNHPGGVAGAAAFGAVVYAHCMASVCAWY